MPEQGFIAENRPVGAAHLCYTGAPVGDGCSPFLGWAARGNRTEALRQMDQQKAPPTCTLHGRGGQTVTLFAQ